MRKFGWFFVIVLFFMLIFEFSQKGVYSAKMGMNMVVVGDTGVSLVLMRPESGVLTLVKMPDNLSVHITESEAVYPLASLWKYSLSEPNGYKIVSKSLSETMGVLLTRVVKVKGDPTPENLLGSMHRLYLQSDLTLRDRILIRKDLVTSVGAKKIFEIEIPKSALTTYAEPDGKEFLDVNFVINLWTKNKFIFETLLSESLNIKIYNLTSKKGAGLLLSKQLEASGLRVVEVSSDYSGKISGKGCIYKISGEQWLTEYLLKKYVGCKNIFNKNESIPKDGVEIWLL